MSKELDPLPYIRPWNDDYIRRAWPDAHTEFEPRPEYEQDPAFYA